MKKLTPVAGLAALVLLAGCGGGSGTTAAPSQPPSQPSSPSATPSAAATEAADTDSNSNGGTPEDTAALRDVSLRSTDLLDSRFANDGDVAFDDRFGGAGPTFDFCGGSFPADSRRVTRYASGVDGSVAGTDARLVEEIVQYDSSDTARSVLVQYETAVDECDGGSHETFLNGGDPATFTPQGKGETDISGLPTPNYLNVTQIRTSDGDGYLATTVVQSGKYLVIGYIANEDGLGTNEGYALGAVTRKVASRVESL